MRPLRVGVNKRDGSLLNLKTRFFGRQTWLDLRGAGERLYHEMYEFAMVLCLSKYDVEDFSAWQSRCKEGTFAKMIHSLLSVPMYMMLDTVITFPPSCSQLWVYHTFTNHAFAAVVAAPGIGLDTLMSPP
jgi:hypothetical protein